MRLARVFGDYSGVSKSNVEEGMSARDKYIHIFGQISSLAERISWSTGVSNMLEWLVWRTNNVLGVTKTDYYKQIVKWTHEDPVRDATLDEKEHYVSQKLKTELKKSEQLNRYAPPKYTIASAREDIWGGVILLG